VPLGEREFWLEELQSIATFEKDGDAVARLVFQIGDRKLVAQRCDPNCPQPKG
jgi:hypothetical protein